MSCCSKIKDILKSIVKALAPILAVALLAFAVYAIWVIGPAALSSVSALSWMPSTVLAMSGTTAGYIALGASLIVDSDTIADIGGEIGEGIGDVVGEVIGGIGGGLVSTFTSSSVFPWLVGAAILWYFWPSDDKNSGVEQPDQVARKKGKGKEEHEPQYYIE